MGIPELSLSILLIFVIKCAILKWEAGMDGQPNSALD